jgi:ATP-dependent Lhr-like helicase
LQKTKGYELISQWLATKKMKPFPFQQEAWEQIHLGNSGLVNAPTGFGKTFSVFLGSINILKIIKRRNEAAYNSCGLHLCVP